MSDNEKPNDQNALVEALAALEHERWSNWMKYLFENGSDLENGGFVINSDSVVRWRRQMHTKYCDLSEAEKESDRKEVYKFLALLVILETRK